MTAKASLKKASAADRAKGDSPSSRKPDYKLIPLKDLQTSPTNPRRRINEETIETLAISIRAQGVLEPAIVRKAEDKFEIVCGERRYRAAAAAGLTELPCLVRELSDEQVIDIQIHENLHREDVHPMDEAYGYQFLKEKLGCDARELALRVGKSEGYVLNRLKLNSLIQEARKDIDENHLPLSYALEIAKYDPEIQRVLYGEVYKKQAQYRRNDYVYLPIKGQMVPFNSFVEWINTNVHHSLAKAPFSTKASNLRDDGLACVNCPDRTGAAASLFGPDQIGKKDACLSPACYRQKAERHISVRRRELAKQAGIEPEQVPLVRSWSYSDGEGYLGSESAVVISGAKRGDSNNAKPCRKAVGGIDIESDNYGKTVQVCLRSSGCKIHWRESVGSSAAASTPNGRTSEDEAAERLEAHRSRREEIWNAKVAEAARVRVFKGAAERFEKKFRITEVGAELLPQLIARFWRMTSSGDSHNLNAVVKHLFAEWGGRIAEARRRLHVGRSHRDREHQET